MKKYRVFSEIILEAEGAEEALAIGSEKIRYDDYEVEEV